VAARPPRAQDVLTARRPNTYGMTRIQLLAAASIAAALTVAGAAGCAAGGGNHAGATPTPAAHSPSLNPQLYHRVAACFRAHGVPNFPEPTENPQTGQWDLPPGTRKPPQSAMTACRSLLEQIPESKGDSGPSHRPPTSAEMVKLKQFAQCMRQHGLADFPDPGADGIAVLPPRYQQLGKIGMRAQLEACQKYNVQGFGMRIQHNGQ
jgi:hypothetical protein